MKAPHLVAALAAFALVILGALSARAAENSVFDPIAPMWFVLQQGQHSLALERLAYERADYMPLYGSSEIAKSQGSHASAFFESFPTGFRVLPIARPGASSLIYAQQIAAIGPAARGQKIVVSLTPNLFTTRRLDEASFVHNFDRLHIYSALFNLDLSWELRRDIARFTRRYPEASKDDVFLRLVMDLMADSTSLDRALYTALIPVGKVMELLLEAQDHWATIGSIPGWRPEMEPLPDRTPRVIDWAAEVQRAEQEARAQSTNNEFGVQNQIWARHSPDLFMPKGSRSDAEFHATVNTSREWADLDVLLRTLREVGADPLIILAPVNGAYFDYLGVSPEARAALYQRLHAAAAPYGIPVVTFEDHDEDRYFSVDPASHLSPKGWIYYNQVLDAFYHGRPLPGQTVGASGASQ
ncbi:MAG: D-alanyl-lipoteichoic acid biosynthesis protein DltD [Anaerolineae bacterium]